MTIRELNEKGIPFAILKFRMSVGTFTRKKSEWILILPSKLHRHKEGMKGGDLLIDRDVVSKYIDDDLPYVKKICTHDDKASSAMGSVWGFNGFKHFMNGEREKEKSEGKKLIKL